MEQSSDNSMDQATILSVRETIGIRLTAQAVNSCAVLRVRTRVNAYALPARFASTTVEAAVASNFDFSEVLRWNLFQADFMTMTRVRDAINAAYPGMARIEDGVTLREGGILAAAEDPDGFAPVPLITGTNRDEMKLYTVFNPQLTRRLGPLVWLRDRDAYEAAVEYPSRNWRRNAVDDLLNRLAANGRSDIWAYRFDWDEGGSVLVTNTGELLGASHAMEIPFVFNHFELFGSFDRILFNDRNAVGRLELADTMGAYWAQFAATGEPGDGIGMGPDWPRWTDTGAALRFDTLDDGGPEVFARTESPLAIASDLAADDRVNDVERCRIAAGMTTREPVLKPIFDSVLDCPQG